MTDFSYKHFVSGKDLLDGYPHDVKSILLGMGCFWGAERLFWQKKGIYVTAVGYAGGDTEKPNYQQVCAGTTNHTEVVLVAYHPQQVFINDLLMTFWESHDPTQGNRQGNDIGSQYRSAIYATDEQQLSVVHQSKERYQQMLQQNGWGIITTEIKLQQKFHLAESYHQQYLEKNPQGYCGLKGTGVECVF